MKVKNCFVCSNTKSKASNSQNSKMDRDEELIARRFQSTF
jgi:hypothetical protein